MSGVHVVVEWSSWFCKYYLILTENHGSKRVVYPDLQQLQSSLIFRWLEVVHSLPPPSQVVTKISSFCYRDTEQN